MAWRGGNGNRSSALAAPACGRVVDERRLEPGPGLPRRPISTLAVIRREIEDLIGRVRSVEPGRKLHSRIEADSARRVGRCAGFPVATIGQGPLCDLCGIIGGDGSRAPSSQRDGWRVGLEEREDRVFHRVTGQRGRLQRLGEALLADAANVPRGELRKKRVRGPSHIDGRRYRLFTLASCDGTIANRVDLREQALELCRKMGDDGVR